jgi:hypothetical protein
MNIFVFRPKAEEILRRSRFLIRQQQYKEMCMRGESMEALQFLKQELGTCVNHQDEVESLEFRNLTSYLFDKTTSTASAESIHAMRSALYEQLLEFFPESMKQPKSNLLDLIQL